MKRADRALLSSIAGAVLLQGCVHDKIDKPLLSQRAFRQIAVACHVREGSYHRQKGSILPYVDIVGQDEVPGQPATLDCLHAALARYRYDFIGVKDPT